MDGKKDLRKKTITKLEVDIELEDGVHTEPTEEIPGNFRTSPLVKLDGQKLGRYLCGYCKTVSYSTFAGSVTEAKVHNALRHDIDDSKFNPEAKMDTNTTSISVYLNMRDLMVRRKFEAIGVQDRKELEGFRNGEPKVVAWMFKKLLLSREAKNVNTLEGIMKESPKYIMIS